jgi:histidinol phosphatase-like PHP family hydrolase
MEINCQPLRLDLPSFLIKKFAQMWWYFLINTDAHNINCLKTCIKYGIWQAKRAYLSTNKVINTYAWEAFKKACNIKIKD